MVKGTSFMGLGGPNLVKGATGQTIDSETLGGAVTHTEISGVAHYAAENDDDNWCQRIKYGQCALRKCNVEGGWKPGTPCDHSLATCARWRLRRG